RPAGPARSLVPRSGWRLLPASGSAIRRKTRQRSRRSPSSRAGGRLDHALRPIQPAPSPCRRACPTCSREGRPAWGRYPHCVGRRSVARRAFRGSAARSSGSDGHAAARGQASAPGGLSRNLFELLGEEELGGLAVGKQCAVERGQPPDKPLELARAPTLELHREVASVAPEHAPCLLLAFEELV